MKTRTRYTIYIRVVLAMLTVLGISAAAYSQTKVVERNFVPPNPPVELIDLKSKDEPLKFGKSFEGGYGWIKDLSFSVKNTSLRNIVHISVAIDFTEIKIPAIFRHSIFLGRPSNTKGGKHLPLLIVKPGESLSVSLSDEYKAFGETLDKYYGADSLTTITVVLGQVHFDDGTMWDLGEFYRPDAERIGHWVLIN